MAGIEPIKVPKWGLSMEEGTIVEWRVKEGDAVAEGDELVDIETTKITNVCEAHMGGVIRRIVADPGRTLPVGALIAVMADASVPDGDVDAFVAEFEAAFDPEEAAAEEAGLEIRSVDIGDGRALRVGVAGPEDSSVSVVLLHGFGADLENLSLVQADLAASVRVYAVELPGHGQSTKQVGAGRLSDLSADVLAAIRTLGLEDLVLIGHSLGGAVAIAVASELGAQVKGLGLVCPAAMPGGDVSREYLDGFVEAKRARDLRKPVEMLFNDKAMVTRDLLDQLVKTKRLDGAQDALTLVKNNLLGDDPDYAQMASKLESVAAPIVLVAAKQDRIVGAPDLSKLPEGVKANLFEEAGHMPHVERTADVVRALRELI